MVGNNLLIFRDRGLDSILGPRDDQRERGEPAPQAVAKRSVMLFHHSKPMRDVTQPFDMKDYISVQQGLEWEESVSL
jgi:hypothetical protein